MKRILLFLVGAVMALSMFAQKLTSVRSFEYPDYVTPHPYDVRKATLGGESLTISYNPNTGYGIKFRYMFRNINISVKFITSGNGKYIYTGTDSSGNKTVVATKRKLNDFLDNVGQTQSESFERDKEIEIAIYGIGDLSIYPLKNTPELQASMEKQAKEREKEKREKEELQLRKDTYEKLCSYTAKNEFNDSVKAFVLNKILENKSLFEKLKLKELSRKVDCIGCVESTGAIKIVKIGEYFLDDILFKEYSSQDNIRYATREGGKLIKDKAFFKTTFNPNDIEYKVVNYGKIKIVGKDRKVVRNNLRAGYITTDVLDIIDSKRLKKGSYDLYFETIGGKAILIKAKKQINPAVSFTCAISVVLIPVLLIQPKNKVIYDFYD
jgi:hypothetical protein|uniref:hypothetical protein n=1 Tax=Bacteroides finegoldii TaxID=338188 RepID=UPI0035618F21